MVTVDFGSINLSPEEKTQRVGGVFHSVAKHYDRMNDLLSFGLHRRWKVSMQEALFPATGDLLDVATGTGDIALSYLAASRRCRAKASTKPFPKVVATDINPSMLEVARSKAMEAGWRIDDDLMIEVANAEDLPYEDRMFDYITMAFGIRNVSYRQRALEEFYRVARAGAKLVIMEFSPSMASPMLDRCYDFYARYYVPWVGACVANDREAYRYLVESIRRFPPPLVFADQVVSAGWSLVKQRHFLGGLVTLTTAFRTRG
jgi:demethylmenaquinone methyltransferase/2-methoxy-6-polyprenyl-1,4-benzoquinol methylase